MTVAAPRCEVAGSSPVISRTVRCTGAQPGASLCCCAPVNWNVMSQESSTVRRKGVYWLRHPYRLMSYGFFSPLTRSAEPMPSTASASLYRGVGGSSRGEGHMNSENTICLWYDGDAEVYAKTFPIRRRRGARARETFRREEGDVLTVELRDGHSLPG